MDNKYNIDYYETMIVANYYLDEIEDMIYGAKELLKDEPEKFEIFLNNFINNNEQILYLEDKLNIYLESNDYQKVSDQLIINELTHIIIKDAIPENDLGYASDYLCELNEREVINKVTRLIDDYNN